MVTIVPVINVKTKQKFLEKLKLLSSFQGLFQIDVADGKFTQWKNWNVPEELKEIKNIRHKFELHLMISQPEKNLPLWLETEPRRVIVHLETIQDFDHLRSLCEEQKVELGLALNPRTEVKRVEKYLPPINFVTILGVNPGPSGQKFQRFVLEKIYYLRQKYPHLNIELDGGVNEEIAGEAIKYGANFLAIGSAIFKDKNPLKKLAEFQKKFAGGKDLL